MNKMRKTAQHRRLNTRVSIRTRRIRVSIQATLTATSKFSRNRTPAAVLRGKFETTRRMWFSTRIFALMSTIKRWNLTPVIAMNNATPRFLARRVATKNSSASRAFREIRVSWFRTGFEATWCDEQSPRAVNEIESRRCKQIPFRVEGMSKGTHMQAIISSRAHTEAQWGNFP